MVEPVPGRHQLAAQFAVGSGDDVDRKFRLGAVEPADGREPRAQAARPPHHQYPATILAGHGAAARRQHVGLDRDPQAVDVLARRAQDHQALLGRLRGNHIPDVLVRRHVPEPVGQIVRHYPPQGKRPALPPGVGREHGEGMRLRADDGVRLEGFHQDAQLVAVSALDQRPDVAPRQQVEPEIVVQRLPQLGRAADGGHVGVLDHGAPGRMRGLQQVQAADVRQRIQTADFGLDGPGRRVVPAVTHQVADQDARGADHAVSPFAAASSPA